MMQRYNSLDDLWCEWPEATTAIMKHVKENEPLESKYEWHYESGCVVPYHRDGYSVVITHTGYDIKEKSTVQLSTQAKVSESNEILITASRRFIN